MTWYNQGYDGLKEEEARMASLGTPDRLWIPPEASKDLIFLDDEPFTLFEHNPKMNGSFKNWMTCLRGVEEEAPCCELLGMKTRYMAGYYTVIDCSEYTDKKGKKHQYEIKFLLAKLKTMKKLKMKKETRGSLTGCVFKATRFDDKSPACGDDFEFVRQVDLDKVFPHVSYRGKKLVDLFAKASLSLKEGADNTAANEAKARILNTFQAALSDAGDLVAKLTPFNYMEQLKPQSVKDLRMTLKSSKIEAWEDSPSSTKTGSDVDESVPF